MLVAIPIYIPYKLVYDFSYEFGVNTMFTELLCSIL